MNASTAAALRVLLRAFGRANVFEALQHVDSLEAVAAALCPSDPKLGWLKLLESAVAMLQACRNDEDFKSAMLAIADLDAKASLAVWAFWAFDTERSWFGTDDASEIAISMARGQARPEAASVLVENPSDSEARFNAIKLMALRQEGVSQRTLRRTFEFREAFDGSSGPRLLAELRPDALRWLGFAMDRGFGFAELPSVVDVFDAR